MLVALSVAFFGHAYGITAYLVTATSRLSAPWARADVDGYLVDPLVRALATAEGRALQSDVAATQ